jgi:hypothetical protein
VKTRGAFTTPEVCLTNGQTFSRFSEGIEMRALISIFIIIFSAQNSFVQSIAGSLTGQVTDQFGAVIVGAKVSLARSDGAEKTAETDGEGRFLISNLAFGSYVLRASATGFALFEQANVEITPNSVRREINIQLSVAVERQEVSVGTELGLSGAPENNAGALTLRETELETLPEDPEELEAVLRSLAGVPVGPDGGQILIDGFINTGQPLPDRNSIREVRINQNPFSAENDRVGFGQIQIITRPGTEKWTGNAFFNFNDESLNSRNPFAANHAPYQMRNYGGTMSGAIVPKRVSVFANFQRRETKDNALVNATLLDENLNAVQLSRIVLTPRRQTNFASRFDFQATSNHTLAASYSFYELSGENFGVGGFSLPERGYHVMMPIHNFQLSETAVIKSKYVNEFRLQYIGENRFDKDANEQPTVNVLGAFTGGAAGIGLASNPEGRLTVQDAVLWTTGKHTLRAGTRLRRTTITDVSPDFFNGSFTFAGGFAPRLDENGEIVREGKGQIVFETITSLERYRRTLVFQRRGFSPSQIRSRGGGATQFARGGGNPRASAEQIDFGAYVQDDWRIRPTFTLALGLRYEFQTNINQNLNLAPRVSFAWIPKFANKDAQKPTTVIRSGFGIFFDRFNESQVLISNKFADEDYFQFVTTEPQFLDAFPFAPSIEQLRQTLGEQRTVWRITDDLREPYMMQAAFSIERQLPMKTTFAATFIAARTFHALRTRNINSPIIIHNAVGEIISTARPLDNQGDIFQYESSGRFNQTQLVLTLNNRFSNSISFFANYTLNRAKSDTDGIGTFPSDNYDLSSEYGRSSTDVRHTFSAGGTFDLPFEIRFNPLIFASSGRPFNITSGRDANLDSWFTDRPAFASDLNKPGIVVTRFGAFDPNPSPGQQIIPRNFGTSQGFFSVNLNVSRIFKFGEAKKTNGKRSEKPYSLAVSARAMNLFNRTNLANPVGNISSPFFGQAVSTAGGFGAASVGNPAAGNRRIELQIRFSF